VPPLLALPPLLVLPAHLPQDCWHEVPSQLWLHQPYSTACAHVSPLFGGVSLQVTAGAPPPPTAPPFGVLEVPATLEVPPVLALAPPAPGLVPEEEPACATDVPPDVAPLPLGIEMPEPPVPGVSALSSAPLSQADAASTPTRQKVVKEAREARRRESSIVYLEPVSLALDPREEE
jgi:hypothetical protein